MMLKQVSVRLPCDDTVVIRDVAGANRAWAYAQSHPESTITIEEYMRRRKMDERLNSRFGEPPRWPARRRRKR